MRTWGDERVRAYHAYAQSVQSVTARTQNKPDPARKHAHMHGRVYRHLGTTLILMVNECVTTEEQGMAGAFTSLFLNTVRQRG